MHFKTVIVTIATTASFVSGLRTPKDLPNGRWTFSLDTNGNTIARSLDNPEQPDVIARNDEPAVANSAWRTKRSTAKLEERCCTAPGAYCWGYYLDHAGVDASGHDMENWLDASGFNQEWCVAGNEWSKGFVENGVMVYLCIDTAYETCEIFDSDDVRYALGEMDAACPAYMAGYYRFNTGESLQPKIIGKCNSGDNICV
ncbi:hypothetical protein N431DRAFT_453007 [Stipitochalara longipes BDJ]|nr:hypothetical protein N431DRAFT_453007 [Stipitochalara longipes BDJ]